jgi:hypothetical protein
MRYLDAAGLAALAFLLRAEAAVTGLKGVVFPRYGHGSGLGLRLWLLLRSGLRLWRRCGPVKHLPIWFRLRPAGWLWLRSGLGLGLRWRRRRPGEHLPVWLRLRARGRLRSGLGLLLRPIH